MNDTEKVNNDTNNLFQIIKGFLFRLFYIFKLVWESSPFILIALTLLAAINGIAPVLGAYLAKNIIGGLENFTLKSGAAFTKILFLLIAFFLFTLIKEIISRINGAVTRIAGDLLIKTTKLKIMTKASGIDISSFDMPEFYENLENANREAGSRPILVLNATFSIFSTIITLISFIVILSEISLLAAVVMIVIAIPSGIVNFIYRKKTFDYIKRSSKDRRQLNYYSDIMVNKDIVKEIRLFGLSRTFIERFQSVFKKYFNGLKKLIIRENLWYLFISLISTVVHCLFFAFVAYKCFKGEIGIADYTYYTGALNSIGSGVSGIVSTTATIYEGTLFINNLISFLNTKPDIVSKAENPPTVKRGKHSIKFENVSFKYPGSDKYVLKNITTEITDGNTVVLVGLNGAGKTTLIKLLTRLYDPTEGRILLDGIDLKEYEPSELYKIFGIIFQDFGKYAETVSENIRFGDIDIPEDKNKIIEAAKSSNVDEYINKLPNKYDTPLTKLFEVSGTELSGGQWQKIAIARAFYGDYDILILDEPTASLDALAEQEIFNQFDNLRKDKITVFVSHRLSSATMANKIIVLNNGQLVEEGDHKSLIKSKGEYYKLFMTQAKRYIENDIENADRQ